MFDPMVVPDRGVVLEQCHLSGSAVDVDLDAAALVLEPERAVLCMFNQGHLSERAFRQLLLTLQLQIDTVRSRGVYHDVPPHRSAFSRLENAALQWSHRVAVLTPLAAR